MATSAHKAFKSPDEVRGFEKGRLELVNIGEGVVGRLILDPVGAGQNTLNRSRRRNGVRPRIFSTTSPAGCISLWRTARNSRRGPEM